MPMGRGTAGRLDESNERLIGRDLRNENRSVLGTGTSFRRYCEAVVRSLLRFTSTFTRFAFVKPSLTRRPSACCHAIVSHLLRPKLTILIFILFNVIIFSMSEWAMFFLDTFFITQRVRSKSTRTT